MILLNNWMQEIRCLFLPLWNHRLFQITLLLNGLMLVLAIIVNYMGLLEPGGNDFRVYYAAGTVFRENLAGLYDTQNYYRPFRYFPLGAFFFTILSYMPQNVSNIIFWIILLIFNIINTHILYYLLIKIYHIPESHHDQIRMMVSMFLFYVPHYENYQMAQNNPFLLFFILCALIFFQKSGGTKIRCLNLTNSEGLEEKTITKLNIIAGFCLGMAANIKPIALIFVPFVILIQIQDKHIYIDLRQSIYRLFGILIPLLPNLLLFIIYPSLWKGFIEINFSGSDELVDTWSLSLVRQILNIGKIMMTPFPEFGVMLGVFIPLFIIGFGIFLFRPKNQENLALYFTIAFTIFMIGYFDTWGHDLTVWGGIALLSLFPLRIFYYPTGLPPKNGPNLYYKFPFLWFLLGGLFWSLTFFITKDIFYPGSPGLNPIHSIYMIIFFISLIRVLWLKLKQQEPL